MTYFVQLLSRKHTKAQLLVAAKELGVRVDKDWRKDRIAELIHDKMKQREILPGNKPPEVV